MNLKEVTKKMIILFNKVKEVCLTSHRPQHFIGGMAVAFIFTFMATLGAASALEFKDKEYGNKWDWIDWSCTIVGGIIGQVCQIGMIKLIFNI